MKPIVDDTWWKRLCTVLGWIAGGIAAVAYLCVSGADADTKIVGVIFMVGIGVGAFYLIKMAVCYVVEGKPSKRPPSN